MVRDSIAGWKGPGATGRLSFSSAPAWAAVSEHTAAKVAAVATKAIFDKWMAFIMSAATLPQRARKGNTGI